MSLVKGGVSEEFLVRSLREVVSSKLGQLANPAEVEERRAELRAWMSAAANDTQLAGRVKPHLASALGAPIAPVTAEQASQSRTERLEWDRRSEVVSDGIIRYWGLANDVMR